MQSYLNDTWIWDGTTWTQQNVVGPSARFGAAAATVSGSVVLFGGQTYGGVDAAIAPPVPLSDTWVWNGTSWIEQNVPGPSDKIVYASMASLGSTALLWNGDETAWIWNGAAWTSAPAPNGSARLTGGGVVCSSAGSVFLLGDEFGLGTETWTWSSGTWIEQSSSGPPVLEYVSLASLNSTVVMFGGQASSGGQPASGATWVWDGTSWAQRMVPGPSPRYGAAMATLNGRIVLFGGIDDGGTPQSDTWTWDGTSWTAQNVVGPPARFFAAMAGP